LPATLSMTLHWSPRSPFVRKVMVTAHELGLAERIALRRTVVRMDTPNRELLPDNPLSKIPTLVLADGAVVTDSLVICEYLDALAGGTLFPRAGEARWAALTRHAIANGLLDALILWRNERDKPEAKRTQGWLDSFAVKTAATLDRFEQDIAALRDGPLTIGHIATACALSYLDFRFADLGWRGGRPALAAWHEEFRARPSMRATEAVDD